MRSNQGITLIALIITVIIMIILAGIGINFIIGEYNNYLQNRWINFDIYR